MSVNWEGTPKQTEWPDTSRDRRAWEQAKDELGPDAIMSDVAARAQQIKDTL